MAEGTSLLRMHTAYTCIVGSNPTVSARTNKKASPVEAFLFVWTQRHRDTSLDQTNSDLYYNGRRFYPYRNDIVEQSTRRRGRVAEGTSLLRMHTAYTCIVGSNPTVSARTNEKASHCGRLFCFS